MDETGAAFETSTMNVGVMCTGFCAITRGKNFRPLHLHTTVHKLRDKSEREQFCSPGTLWVYVLYPHNHYLGGGLVSSFRMFEL
jgi:hypothetical protein